MREVYFPASWEALRRAVGANRASGGICVQEFFEDKAEAVAALPVYELTLAASILEKGSGSLFDKDFFEYKNNGYGFVQGLEDQLDPGEMVLFIEYVFRPKGTNYEEWLDNEEMADPRQPVAYNQDKLQAFVTKLLNHEEPTAEEAKEQDEVLEMEGNNSAKVVETFWLIHPTGKLFPPGKRSSSDWLPDVKQFVAMPRTEVKIRLLAIKTICQGGRLRRPWANTNTIGKWHGEVTVLICEKTMVHAEEDGDLT
jgi:hypothetical protein